MIKILSMNPFYTKVSGTKLRIVFVYQCLSIEKDGEVYHFIPIEGKEITVNMNTHQVENLAEVLVFQRGAKFVRLPLYQFLLVTNVQDFLNPIIDKAKGSTTIEEELVAKVNFKGFSDSRNKNKAFYFKTNISNLKKGDTVIVDSLGEKQKANFLGYIANEYDLDFIPTKYILEKYEVEASTVEKSESRRSEEYVGVKKLNKETELTFEEIMQFHKEAYIDRCLENGDYDAIHAVM